MNRLAVSLAASLPLLALIGCSGSSQTPAAPGPTTTQTFGPVTTRIVGAAQSPVFSSAANGANVTGIAGALIDSVMLNPQGPPTLKDSKIAFHSYRIPGNNEIFTMNADGTSPLNLSNVASNEFHPSWSPDGSKIAYVGDSTGNLDIYTMDPTGTVLAQLTNSVFQDNEPKWSPDGSKIVFTSNRDGNNEIYSMNADGTGQTRLTVNAASDSSPSWSPDNNKIVFVSNRDGNNEIYAMNANGTSQTRLTADSGNDFSPSWSPDGNFIAFCSFRAAGNGIYSISPSNQNLKLIYSNPAPNALALSPDGKQIVFINGGQAAVIISTSGAFVAEVPSYGVSSLSWSNNFPRVPYILAGAGGYTIPTAAGFLMGQKGNQVTSLLAFDTTTAASRAGARVAALSQAETQGSNLVFSITTTAGLFTIAHVNISENGVPDTAVYPALPVGTTNALVSFDAQTGLVASVLPYAANRSAGLKTERNGDKLTVSASFTAVFDASGKNLASGGAKSVTIDEKSGKLVRFE